MDLFTVADPHDHSRTLLLAILAKPTMGRRIPSVSNNIPPITSSIRIPALDGLRGIAILLVLLWHSVFQVNFTQHPLLHRLVGIGRLSWSGVDLFFVLSGFLIGGILLDRRDSATYFKTFYMRRAYRILPLYFLIVTLCWLTFQAGHHGWTPYGKLELFKGRVPWWTFFTLTQNMWMAGMGGFSRASLSVTWSLAIEEQFYLTLPFIVRRIAANSLIYLSVGVVFAAAILRAILLAHFPNGGFASYVLMPCRADALALGVLCAILVRKPRSWNWLLTHPMWITSGACILGACVAWITYMAFPIFTDALYGLEYTVLALFYACVLLIAVTGSATGKRGFVNSILCNNALMKLGVIAYGTYLLHYICINSVLFLLLRHTNLPPTSIYLGAPLLGIGVAVCLAGISWRLFEKPLLRHAQFSSISQAGSPEFRTRCR
jgi:peptidoglycan/LPS O-acetylase OafA/YrhL